MQEGAFARAGALAEQVLREDGRNGQAAAIRALVRFQTAMHELREQAIIVLRTADASNGFDHPRMRGALERTAEALAAADADLAITARDRQFSLELCLACWERDWNHSGEIDRSDRRLFQIEIDGAGRPFPEGDPRRKPTFRFDIGDIHWARAMLSFQRAALELVLAYRWTELDRLLQSTSMARMSVVTIRLEQPGRIARVRALILAGVEHAERSRLAYLAETDDDREWVPNPRQRNHPLPLPVDAGLYEVWAGVLGDVKRLVTGEEALSVAQLAQLGDHQWEQPPRGYIDIGLMLSEPKDIVFDIPALMRKWESDYGARRAQVEDSLKSVLGGYYDLGRERKASPVIGRLSRMKREMERGEDTLERKLRYLLWLN